MSLLSCDPVLFNYRSQYQSFVLPFFVLASVDGYARLRQWRASEARGGGGGRAGVVPSGGAPPPPPPRVSGPPPVPLRLLPRAGVSARAGEDFFVARRGAAPRHRA